MFAGDLCSGDAVGKVFQETKSIKKFLSVCILFNSPGALGAYNGVEFESFVKKS